MKKSDKIKKLYDVCHTDYDLHMVKTGHYEAQEKIISLLLDEIKEPIFDLACGTGFMIKKLSTNYSRVYGNDFSLSMVEMASKSTGRKITNENAEILESHSRKKFKTIICCNLFFYLQNRNTAIKRWANLLDKDGQVIFIEEYPFIQPISEEMDKHTKELMSLVDPISPTDIQKLMTQNGFKINKEIRIKIDEKHDLYGLVFSLN
jgi:ubiquinone/menaquinone biosynthesis C-methylase UbiE